MLTCSYDFSIKIEKKKLKLNAETPKRNNTRVCVCDVKEEPFAVFSVCLSAQSNRFRDDSGLNKKKSHALDLFRAVFRLYARNINRERQ